MNVHTALWAACLMTAPWVVAGPGPIDQGLRQVEPMITAKAAAKSPVVWKSAASSTNAPARVPKTRSTVAPVPDGRLKPGVYKTAPSALIVIVPGAHPSDDGSIIRPPDSPEMPIISPKLEFIPKSTKEK